MAFHKLDDPKTHSFDPNNLFIDHRTDRVGIGIGDSPTARLHVTGGTAEANTAGFKLDSGELLTSIETGALEFDGTDLWFSLDDVSRVSLTGGVDTEAIEDAVGNLMVDSATVTWVYDDAAGELTANVVATTPGTYVTGSGGAGAVLTEGTVDYIAKWKPDGTPTGTWELESSSIYESPTTVFIDAQTYLGTAAKIGGTKVGTYTDLLEVDSIVDTTVLFRNHDPVVVSLTLESGGLTPYHSADAILADISARWGYTNKVAAINFHAGSDTVNMDEGKIAFQVANASGLVDTLILDRDLTFDFSGYGAVGGAASPNSDLAFRIDRDWSTTGGGTLLHVQGAITITDTINATNHGMWIKPAFDVDPGVGKTVNNLSSITVQPPDITHTSGTLASAASIRVVGAPNEAGENYAIHVQADTSRFEGNVLLGDTSSGVTADGNANHLVIDSNAAAGMTILSGTGASAWLYFGNPSDSTVAYLQYEESSDSLNLGTRDFGGVGVVNLRTGNDTIALTVGADQKSEFFADVGIGIDPATYAGRSLTVLDDAVIRGTGPKLFLMETDGLGDESWMARVAYGVFRLDSIDDAITGSTTINATALYALQDGSVSVGAATAPTSTLHVWGDAQVETDLNVDGTAAIGGISSPSANVALLLNKAFTATANSSILNVQADVVVDTSAQTHSGIWTSVDYDIQSAAAVTAVFGASFLPPSITYTSGSVGQAATVRITGAPSGASYNYGLIVDAGDVRIDDNLGIGVTTPLYPLHVVGETYVDGDLRVEDNLGISVATPLYPLHVVGEAYVDGDFTTTGAFSAVDLVASGGTLGVGTDTVPHGGNGGGIVSVRGVNSDDDGPHVQFFVSTDDYPVMTIMPWSHDNAALLWDGYYEQGVGWLSSSVSSFMIRKYSSELRFQYGTSSGGGTATAWQTSYSVDTSGHLHLHTGKLSAGNSSVSGYLHLNSKIQTSNGDANVYLFSDGTTSSAQAGLYQSKLHLYGGGGQTRRLSLSQTYNGDALIETNEQGLRLASDLDTRIDSGRRTYINERTQTSANADVVLFSTDSSTAQSGAFNSKLMIFGGSSQTRRLDLYQAVGGDAYITSTGNRLRLGTASNSQILIEPGNGYVGINTDNPQAKLHVSMADTGSAYASGNSDELLLENNGHVGMQLYCPDASRHYIRFGTPGDSIGAEIQFDYTNRVLYLGSASNSSSRTSIKGGNGVEIAKFYGNSVMIDDLSGSEDTWNKFVVDGASSSNSDGPHMAFRIAGGAEAAMQIRPYNHDNIHISWDAHKTNAWRSSDAGSNFVMIKNGDKWQMGHDTGVSVGSAPSWKYRFSYQASDGFIGINQSSPTEQFHMGAGNALMDNGNFTVTSGHFITPTVDHGILAAGTNTLDAEDSQRHFVVVNTTSSRSVTLTNWKDGLTFTLIIYWNVDPDTANLDIKTKVSESTILKWPGLAPDPSNWTGTTGSYTVIGFVCVEYGSSKVWLACASQDFT